MTKYKQIAVSWQGNDSSAEIIGSTPAMTGRINARHAGASVCRHIFCEPHNPLIADFLTFYYFKDRDCRVVSRQ